MAITQVVVGAESEQVLAADADDDRQVVLRVVSGPNVVFVDTATATAAGGFPVDSTAPVTFILAATEVLHGISPNGDTALAVIDSVITTPA